MKPKYTGKTVLAALAVTSGPLLAQTTTWYGVNNTAAAAGATGIDAYSAVTDANWHDAQINGGSAAQQSTPNGAVGNAGVRARKTNVVTQSQLISVLRLDGLTITDMVTNATVWLNFSLISSAAPFDVSFVPISNSATWTEADATWDSLVDTGYLDNTSTANAQTITGPDGWRSFDVTSLFAQMVAGGNDGIAIVLPQVISSGSAYPNLTWASSENSDPTLTPGFSVTTIPEPSAALLGGLGLLGLVLRRRR